MKFFGGTFTRRQALVRMVFIFTSSCLWAWAAFSITNAFQGVTRSRQGYEALVTAPAEVIGPHPNILGDAKAAYTIVEFGDYQCPYCRQASPGVESILKALPGRVRLVFRNLPIVSIHDRAMEAAIGAEASAEQGKFAAVHGLLMSSDLGGASLTAIAEKSGVDMQKAQRFASSGARQRVAEDMAEAAVLHVSGTPTFLLVDTKQAVMKFDSLDKLENYLARETGQPVGSGQAAGTNQAGQCGSANASCGPS